MSLFSWLAPRKRPPILQAPSSGLSRMESTRPAAGLRGGATAQPANRKQERMARRELLYGVVREAMVRAGVLSTAYKFKVLSLDARGRQFMVMVDLAQASVADATGPLAEIEATIAQWAKARHDIVVTAVYWRSSEHVAVGEPAAPAQARAAVPMAEPAVAIAPPNPRFDDVSRPAELLAETPAPQPATHYDPLHPDEVAAFRRALAMGVAAPVERRASHRPATSYALLTGFEDTEVTETDASVERLSGTQYGELR